MLKMTSVDGCLKWLLSDGTLTRIMIFFICGAAVLSVYEHVITKAVDGLSFTKLLLLGLGALLAELLGVHRLITSWHEARPFSMIVWAGIWCIGFAFSVYNTVGSASHASVERASIQKAAYIRDNTARSTAQQAEAFRNDKREALKRTELALSQAVASRQDMHKAQYEPVVLPGGMQADSPAAVKALIEGAENNTIYKSTSECTNATAKRSRAFCADLTDLRAALATLEKRELLGQDKSALDAKIAALTKERDTAADRLERAEAAYQQAQQAASVVPVVLSEDTPLVHQVSYATGMKPETVRWLEAAQISFVGMLLVSFAGFVLGLEAIAGRPRTRWVNWKPMYDAVLWFGYALRGKVVPPETRTEIVHTREVVKDDGFQQRLRASAAKAGLLGTPMGASA
jgi:hypothetical protein